MVSGELESEGWCGDQLLTVPSLEADITSQRGTLEATLSICYCREGRTILVQVAQKDVVYPVVMGLYGLAEGGPL